MDNHLIALCSFIVICGLIKCIIIGTGFEKHYALISGLIIVMLLVNGLKDFDITSLPITEEEVELSRNDYSDLVILNATELLQETISDAVLSRYGCRCDSKVVLRSEDNRIYIDSVELTGIEEIDYIRLYLADYLSVEEDVISFG